MTNNKVYVGQNGNEMVMVNRADGLGVSEIKKLGIEQIIISTENNTVVSTRASKLRIPCLQGINKKKEALMDYCQKNNIDLKNVVYVGNDINDKEAMALVGMPICPADSHESIKKISKVVLHTDGGDGVVREILDLITKDEFEKGYYIASYNKKKY